MAPALIIIDLQNDFITPGFALRKRYIRYEVESLKELEKLCAQFRAGDHPVIFVRSEYTAQKGSELQHNDTFEPVQRSSEEEYQDAPMNDDHLSGTCTGLFCRPGTEGTNFPASVQALVDKYGSHVVTKQWYSSFTETDLHKWLQEQGVKRGPLYFAGVTANNCVLATLTDAFFLRYQVYAISDCIGARADHLRVKAFEKMERYYGSVISADRALETLTAGTATQPERTLYYVNGSIPSWRVMLALAYKQLPYNAKRLKVMSRPKETREPEFAALNPRMKTPTLIDSDGTVMIESQAILQYLETYYPEHGPQPLMPSPDKKDAYMSTLQVFHESENAHYVFEDIELLFLGTKIEQSDLAKAIGAYEGTIKELPHWERKLEKHPFVAGDEFSLADCAFYPCLAYMVHRGLDLTLEGFPKLKDYYWKIYGTDYAKQACPVGWEMPKKNVFAKASEMSLMNKKLAELGIEEE